MKFLIPVILLAISFQETAGQNRDSTKVRATRSTTTPRTDTPDPTQSDLNLRLNALNGAGTAPLIWRVDTRYEGLRGTPYFQPDWSKGQIQLTNGRKYTDVPIKFDAHRQALVLLRPKQGNDSIIIDQQTVRHFLVANPDGQEYLFKRYPALKTDDPQIRDGYFMVLYEGKTALLKRVVKLFKSADYKGAYNSNPRYDAYTDANAYYVLKADQTLTKIKLAKKSLLDALSDKEEALKTFVTGQKLEVKSEADAVSLVQHYDTL